MAKTNWAESPHRMAFNPDALLRRVSGVGTPDTAILQAIANSCDAGAKNIWVIWDSRNNTAVIADDGFGIAGEIPENDFEALQCFDWGNINSSHDSDDHPLDYFEKPTSAISFWYMMLSAGFSVKNYPPVWRCIQDIVFGDSKLEANYNLPQGEYGVGLLETMGVADVVRIQSRPMLQLANYHYDRRFRSAKSVPAFELVLPDINNRSLEFTVTEMDKMYFPFSQREYIHGTVVYLEGINSRIKLEHLKMTIARLFGMFILSNNVSISVGTVKRRAEKFKDRPDYESVAFSPINPTLLTGKPLMIDGEREIHVRVREWMAIVELFHVGKEGQITPPVFVRRGVIGRPVTDLPGLFDGAWTDSRLTGYVHLLSPAEVAVREGRSYTETEDAHWNLAKDLPNLKDPNMNRVVKQVASLEPQIADRMQEIDDQKAEDRVTSLEQLIEETLTDVTRTFGDFFDIDTPGTRRRGSGRKKPSGTGKPNLDMRVVILNEHMERVGTDFTFEVSLLNSRGKELDCHRFKGGANSFTRRGKGVHFAFEIYLPKEVSLASGQAEVVPFELVKGQGITVVFNVITNEDKRRKHQFSGSDINIRLRSLGPDGIIWDTDKTLSHGIVEFNIDYPFFAEAFEEGETKIASLVLAGAIADAISFVAYGNQTDPTILMQTQRLANRLAARIMAGWRKRPKR